MKRGRSDEGNEDDSVDDRGSARKAAAVPVLGSMQSPSDADAIKALNARFPLPALVIRLWGTSGSSASSASQKVRVEAEITGAAGTGGQKTPDVALAVGLAEYLGALFTGAHTDPLWAFLRGCGGKANKGAPITPGGAKRLAELVTFADMGVGVRIDFAAFDEWAAESAESIGTEGLLLVDQLVRVPGLVRVVVRKTVGAKMTASDRYVVNLVERVYRIAAALLLERDAHNRLVYGLCDVMFGVPPGLRQLARFVRSVMFRVTHRLGLEGSAPGVLAQELAKDFALAVEWAPGGAIDPAWVVPMTLCRLLDDHPSDDDRPTDDDHHDHPEFVPGGLGGPCAKALLEFLAYKEYGNGFCAKTPADAVTHVVDRGLIVSHAPYIPVCTWRFVSAAV